MSKYIPFPMFYDDVPIDISFAMEQDIPAGKRGFLKCDGDVFRFEDGTEAKFWGVNINGGANFPTHEYAEKFATRLARTGCNIVRYHQLDAEWDIPNIFCFKRGKRQDDTRHLDPESMDRLDYLIYILKEKGIYSYLDMLTYRRFKVGDGVESTDQLVDASRQPYAMYDRKMIELQKEFIHDIWNHFNPYTGLKYKDDPAIVMTEIINECDLIHQRQFGVEPYTSDFRKRFRAWLDENGIEFDAEGCDLCEETGEEITAFKYKLHIDYFNELREYMREVGVKIPIAGTNYTMSDEMVRAQLVNDFTDSHTYLCDWKWNDGIAMYKSMTECQDPAFTRLTRMRVKDKPFFVSEWDMPWPNPFRAESPLLYAAVGSYQRWCGFAIHTYSYSTRLNEQWMVGKELHSDCVNGVCYRVGMFSTWNDPAKYGLFYHAALMTRRGDVKPTDVEHTFKIGTKPRNGLEGAVEYCRVYSAFDDGADAAVCPFDDSKKEVKSVDGQLYRSWEKNYGYINTENTKAVYGFFEKNGEIKIDGLTVKSDNEHGVIAISTLSNEPIAKSDNILITAIGDAINTDMKYERVGESEMRVADMGKPPVLAEVIEAEITLENCYKGSRVMAIDPEGFYVGEIKTEYENGCLKFKIGDKYSSIYYLVVRD